MPRAPRYLMQEDHSVDPAEHVSDPMDHLVNVTVSVFVCYLTNVPAASYSTFSA